MEFILLEIVSKYMKMKRRKVVIIGAGFSSLSAACFLAQSGYETLVLEKNSAVGGRARQLHREGYTFDLGPTFYWMPDVFEHFFKHFGKSVSDYYSLIKLDPAYQVYFGKEESICIGDNLQSIIETYERIEPGSGKRLSNFISQAKSNYELAMNDLVYQPGERIYEIVNRETLRRLSLFMKSIKGQVARVVKDARLRRILEFPVLFLGAKADDTPAFYNFMNYADFGLGTWHPVGGMYKVVEAIHELARELGVQIITQAEVTRIEMSAQKISRIFTSCGSFDCDILLSGADYAYTEQLLPPECRQYSPSYWRKRRFAPSALLFFVGFDSRLKNVSHHTLFFDTDFEAHERSIYEKAEWPQSPLFYASFPSISEHGLSPPGKEVGTFLIPIAPGLEDTDERRSEYFQKIIGRLESVTDQPVMDKVLFHESFCVNDFVSEYNSYEGNAYGLANTLLQTHRFRPRIKSNRVSNLYFTGQLTVPGPGVPPSLISGQLASDLIKKYHPLA